MEFSRPQKDQIKKSWPPGILWGLSLAIMTATIIFDLHTPLGVACAVPYTLAVLVIAFTKSRWSLLGAAVVTSLLTIIGMGYSPQMSQVPSWQFVTNRALTLFTIWVVALVMMNRATLQAKEEAAQARLRVLEGILPICAECKKIRDSSNIWHRIESYITQNSEATFTHGYCPECAQRAIAQF